MTKFTSSDYVKYQQYSNADKLAARIRFHAAFNTNPLNQRRWLFDLMLAEIKPGSRILEIGCGRGDLWKENAERIPADWSVTLTDISEGMLNDCRNYLGEDLANRFQFDVQDIQHLQYDDNLFDAVLANWMLYHVDDRDKAIAGVRRVLKPDGVFFAGTNGDHHLDDLFTVIRRFEQDDRPYVSAFSQTFSLQNGEAQLRKQFGDVCIEYHRNSLHVTDLDPLLGYVASVVDQPEQVLTSENGQKIIAELQERLQRDGMIIIGKDEGVFIAKGRMMNKFQSADYLKQQQYAGADKLAARIRIHEQFSTNQTDFQKWEFDLLLERVKPEARVLEVGAGRGDLWKKNAGRIPSGWQITLSDLSAGMLDDNRKYVGNEQRFEYREFDVQSIPFEDASFDVVIANYMLYHVSDLPKALSEIRRVLKPGGVLFAMTNGDDHLKELIQLTDQFAGGVKENFGLMNVRGSFSTQNGDDSLLVHFAEVEFIRFESDLYVRQLQPLLDYIASSVDHPETEMNTEHAQRLTAELQRRIESEGGISITKDTGLFIARGMK